MSGGTSCPPTPASAVFDSWPYLDLVPRERCGLGTRLIKMVELTDVIASKCLFEIFFKISYDRRQQNRLQICARSIAWPGYLVPPSQEGVNLNTRLWLVVAYLYY